MRAFAIVVFSTIGIIGAGIAAEASLGHAGSGVAPTISQVEPTAQQLARSSWMSLPAISTPARIGEVALAMGDELLYWGGSEVRVAKQPQPLPTSAAIGFVSSPRASGWVAMPAAPIQPRADVAAVWTGNLAILWGGDSIAGSSTRLFGDGAAFDPTTRSWRRLPPAPIRSVANATAIWTGQRVVIAGGDDGSASTPLTVASFDPSTWTWSSLPSIPYEGPGQPVGVAIGRTGDELVAIVTYQLIRRLSSTTVEISGHQGASTLADGAPTWERTTTPPTALHTLGATVLTDGAKLLFVGGSGCLPAESCPGPLPSPVGVFAPSKSAWAIWPRNTIGDIALGWLGPVIWTGATIVSFDVDVTSEQGHRVVLRPGDGAAFDVASRQWIRAPTLPCTALVYGVIPLWTGTRLVVIGGSPASSNVVCVSSMTFGS